MPLFDAYVFVDWSAANSLSPAARSADAIWVGERTRGGARGESYWRGRGAATAHVRRRLAKHLEAGRRVLVGFDFPCGYPAGLSAALGLGGPAPWRAVWDHLGGAITDDDANRSNRFAVADAMNRIIGRGPGPFWGCPPSAATPSLTSTRKGLFDYPFDCAPRPLAMKRVTEQQPATKGVQEAWRLAGAGSVGSQALVGVPRVRALRVDPDLASCSAVWPFETGFTASPVPAAGPFVLHAEIWPGIVNGDELLAEVEWTGAIRDQAQVRLMCRWAAALDDRDELGARFDAPAGPAPAGLDAAVREEGWILS